MGISKEILSLALKATAIGGVGAVAGTQAAGATAAVVASGEILNSMNKKDEDIDIIHHNSPKDQGNGEDYREFLDKNDARSIAEDGLNAQNNTECLPDDPYEAVRMALARSGVKTMENFDSGDLFTGSCLPQSASRYNSTQIGREISGFSR